MVVNTLLKTGCTKGKHHARIDSQAQHLSAEAKLGYPCRQTMHFVSQLSQVAHVDKRPVGHHSKQCTPSQRVQHVAAEGPAGPCAGEDAHVTRKLRGFENGAGLSSTSTDTTLMGHAMCRSLRPAGATPFSTRRPGASFGV